MNYTFPTHEDAQNFLYEQAEAYNMDVLESVDVKTAFDTQNNIMYHYKKEVNTALNILQYYKNEPIVVSVMQQ